MGFGVGGNGEVEARPEPCAVPNLPAPHCMCCNPFGASSEVSSLEGRLLLSQREPQ